MSGVRMLQCAFTILYMWVVSENYVLVKLNIVSKFIG